MPGAMARSGAAVAGGLGGEGAGGLRDLRWVSGEMVRDAVFGRFAPCGRLPFEKPSSMDAVWAQLPDVPFDSANPAFPFGHGLGF
jgi:hypothetical protein